MRPVVYTAQLILTLTALINTAANQTTISYEDLGEFIGRHHHRLNHTLITVGRVCRVLGWPRLESLVVYKRTREHGRGYRPEAGRTWEQDRDECWQRFARLRRFSTIS